ncbi:O-antigen ligase family protein [Ruegeria lacuscaerulensis]|uniref:O-antigen ligase family protein n=1 Tax=Ruegeria lacuscaerulensis TaxID=55218 RepID=UPI00147F8784|nr:O-antigen ligase family protein [Ruegeria lacuscaerulensis]
MSSLLRSETGTDRAFLRYFASAFGFFLWFPALAVPAGPMSLQVVDLLAVASWPLLITQLPKTGPRSFTVICLSLFSALVAFQGETSAMILAYYFLFLTPFLLMVSHIIMRDFARMAFVKSFAFGGAVSCVLFLAQIVVGADLLDFRNNTNFSLPPQHGRGFALFPEVSTFATHVIYLLAVLIVAWRSGVIRKFFPYGRTVSLIIIALICLALSKSSSVLVILPAVLLLAYLKGRRLTYKGLLGVLLACGILVIALQLYYSEFYLQRAEGSAMRSIGLRLVTMKTGLSVIENGEIFGVGLGNNEAVTYRSYEVARHMGFPLILLPKGINSFVVARIFEEGWMAILFFGMAAIYLLGAIRSKCEDPWLRCLVALAFASFLVSLLVTGYRGIYMNWFWIAAAPAIVDCVKLRRRGVVQRG